MYILLYETKKANKINEKGSHFILNNNLEKKKAKAKEFEACPEKYP